MDGHDCRYVLCVDAIHVCEDEQESCVVKHFFDLLKLRILVVVVKVVYLVDLDPR